MAEAITVQGPVSGTTKTLSFETGKLAQQSQGAVVGRLGDTVVLVTANAATGVREGIDFFPLTVDIEERAYAAGKIPGSFFRREGRPSDAAILTCRLIDRPLRPSFAEGYRNETQVVGTIIGVDLENPHDVLSINAASAALMLSGIPFDGPIGAVRIAYSVEGTWVPHATYQEGDASTFELVVAGRQIDGDIAIMMVEAGGTEHAWTYYEAGAPKVTEEVIAQGLEEAKTWIRESIELQNQLVAKAGVHAPIPYVPQVDYGQDVFDRVAAIGTDQLAKAQTIADKADRNAATDEATASIMATLEGEFEGRGGEIKQAVRSLTKKVVRKRIVEEGVRIDGRGAADIRALSAEVGILPTAHGSALFQRGETQVLSVTTLGMPRMDQLLDTLGVEDRKRYMHHYNMPPHANGEVGRVGSPKRREIGHGLLAERALFPVVPSQEEFPYTLRLVSEVLASNGSTSMGSVCASTLSLMDAGVPIKAPVAGIAMGLVFAEGKYTTLTDILGAEDAFGDMDFKVAGTADFVTALQLDTKIDGLPADVLAKALQQAKEARLQILEVMKAAISEPRAEVAATAPKIVSFQIPMDKIGEVIGPKGKVINAMQQETGADIAVDDDGKIGTVTIGAKDGSAVAEARRRIELILDPPKAEIGAVYPGKVVNVTKFGAFVNILPGRDGLLHISKIGGRRIDKVEDVLNLGDDVDVRVDDIDPQGKVSLSLASEPPAPANGRSSSSAPSASSSGAAENGDARVEVSFEDSFDQELAQEFGDLGPADAGVPPSSGGREGWRPRQRRRSPRSPAPALSQALSQAPAQQPMRVAVFGAAGRMGTQVCQAVLGDPDCTLVAAVDPNIAAAQLPPGVLGGTDASVIEQAQADVAIDFTVAMSARANAEWCAAHGVHDVIGTSGLGEEDLAAIRAAFTGTAHCIVAPNFAIGAVLMIKMAELAAPWFETAEIIELHHDGKADAPSGTAIHTAERMAAASAEWAPDPTKIDNLPEARGARSESGIRIHSVRMRGMIASQEVILGTTGQSLAIRHDTFDRSSFMPGVLVAIKRVADLPGLTVGLDVVLGL